MTGATRWWIGATAAAGVLVAVTMVLLGMEPRLVLVACVVLAVACACRLLIDLGGAAAPIVWTHRSAWTDPSATTDRRVQALRGWLRRPARGGRLRDRGSAEGAVPTEIADALVGLIDDLLVEHGIDRASDARAAEDLLGPELARFVGDPVARRSMTQRSALPRTLALIEDLPSSPSLH